MVFNYRKILIYFSVFALSLSIFILAGCSLLGGKRGEVPKIEIIVDNPLPIKRVDEFVVLKIATLKEFAPDFSHDTFIVLHSGSNQSQEIPHQLDDIDNDGEGDEIAMILDLEPGERKRIEIRYAPEGAPKSRSVKLGYDRRTRTAIHPEYEGIGWESELIAYRIYPDHRNSIGVFGKQDPGLSLDKFAASVADRGYNQLEAWGVSILDGGDSTGCGGFGVWHNNKFLKPPDNVARYTRIVADGPIRSVVQVIYDKWSVGGEMLRVTATYSIFAGQVWTRTAVKVEGANNPVKIAAGLVESGAATLTRNDEEGLFYTWGMQSHRDTPDYMGMAMIYPKESFDSFHEEEDDSEAHLSVLNPGADNEIIYWSLAAWSSGEIGVKRERQFAELASSIARRLSHPLTATVMPVKQPPVSGAPQESS